MKVITKKISEISNHKFLRFDCKYWIAQRETEFPDYIRLSDLFSIIGGSVQTSHYSNEKTECPYVRIGDIEYKFGINLDNCIFLDNVDDVPDEKILKNDDLVLATIGATVGKIGIANQCYGGTYSNNTVILRAKNSNMNVCFYEKLFQTDFYMKYIFGVVSQKAQPNLQEYDLQNIRIPILTQQKIEETLKLIQPINDIIINKRASIIKVQDIIDNTFVKQFSFDFDKFMRLKSIKQYKSSIAMFASDPDLRFSAKFHREAGDFVMSQLSSVTDKKIKHFLSEPIVLGASISPGDFDENGSAYYVSMATIKSLEIELDESQRVSDAYYTDNINKSLRTDDIIIARSGVAIGKTAIVKQEFDGIFADFTMRIRLDKSRYNPDFAYYYFRTSYFQYLIEVYKKGLQNQNIFPIVMQEFPLIDIPLDEQQRIVDEIHAEIAKQDAIKAEIADLRAQIDKIIEDTICAD